MSRFHSSDQEIKETFLRNIDVELDDNQQMYLLFAITAIVEKPSLSIEELMDLSPLAVVFNQTGLANRYLRDLVHHVRRFSVAGPVTEIPDESNSAGVSSLTNPGFGSSADGQGETNNSNETVADGQAVPAAHSNWSVDAVAGSAAPSQITGLTAETEDTSISEGGDQKDEM